MPKKGLTQEEFLERCMEKFGDKYGYSKCVLLMLELK